MCAFQYCHNFFWHLPYHKSQGYCIASFLDPLICGWKRGGKEQAGLQLFPRHTAITLQSQMELFHTSKKRRKKIWVWRPHNPAIWQTALLMCSTPDNAVRPCMCLSQHHMEWACFQCSMSVNAVHWAVRCCRWHFVIITVEVLLYLIMNKKWSSASECSFT